MKKTLFSLLFFVSFWASGQGVDTLALEKHAAATRYKLIEQGATVLPGDEDYFLTAKQDYDQLVSLGRTKNLLYRAAIYRIKTGKMSFDPAKNAASLLMAKQGLQDILAYEKIYGVTAESTRYREGLERNIQVLSPQ